MNKNLWSVSYVLVTSSSAFLVMTLLYVFVDVLSWWSGAPLRYAGKGWKLATQFDNWWSVSRLPHLWKLRAVVPVSWYYARPNLKWPRFAIKKKRFILTTPSFADFVDIIFPIVGMNAILLYVGHVLAKPMLPFTWSPLSPTHGAHYAMNVTSVIIWIMVAWILYRFKVFLTL